MYCQITKELPSFSIFFFFNFRRCISVFALTNARKVSFRNSLWWPTYRIFNSVGKTNLFYISFSLHMFCCFPFSCDSLYIPKLYTFCLFEDMFNEWQMVTFVCRGLHFRALFTKHKRQINDWETIGYQEGVIIWYWFSSISHMQWPGALTRNGL